MRTAARLAGIVAGLVLSGPATAETDVAGPGGPACGARAGLYATGKGLRIWVTRSGSMEQENPLRPLTPDRFVVLQVVVNGRVATAYGRDHDNLRQGGPPQDLEREGATIRWQREGEGLPDAIRVVAEDGTVLLGPVRFAECAEAPTVAAPKPASRRTPAARPGGTTRDPSKLPQGAIPTLSLPKRSGD